LTQNTAGGSAAAGGMDYQARCAALASTAILATTAAPALGPWAGPIVRIDCETAEPVDDIRLLAQTGPNVVIQCKRSIQLSAKATSELAKTVDQFVRHHRAVGHEADELVLATSSSASEPVRVTLRLLLDRIRQLPDGDDISSVANNQSEETALRKFLDHVLRIWKTYAGVDLSLAELRTFLKRVHVLVLDVGPGEPGEQLGLANLGHVVDASPDAAAAWALLCSHADGMAVNQSGADLAVLQGHLAMNGIRLVGAVDFQGDVAQLKAASARELDRLNGTLVTIPGPAGDINIARGMQHEIEAAAAMGPVLVTGDPGAGKTVAVFHLAQDLRAAGNDVAFLPVGTSKARSLGDLNGELGLDHHIFDVLAQWAPGTKKTLIIDSLDAARAEGQADLWRHLIDHVNAKLPDWHVVVTIRRWDLQHSQHLKKQFPSGPVVVGDLNDEELASASADWPELTQVIESAPADFRTLIRNPFNLRLAADLLISGVPLGTLQGLDTQIALLDGYWAKRVSADPGGLARHGIAGAVARRALEAHTMTVDTASILQGDTAAAPALTELLSRNTLKDATMVPLPWPPAVVAFAHHLLHDYAVSLQFHGSQGLIGELDRDPNLAIIAAPSIDLYLQRLWDHDPSRFWATVIELQDAGVGALPIVQAADIAARNLTDAGQLDALTTPVHEGTATDTHLRLLRYLAFAYVLDRRENPTIKPGPWVQLALRLCVDLRNTEWIVRILVSELAGVQPALTGADMGALGEAARAALTHLWAGGPTPVNRVAIRSVVRATASDVAATEALLRRALEPARLASHGASDLWQLTGSVPELLPHCPGLVHDIYTVVMAYEEQSKETTHMLGGQLLSLTSNRRQDVESAKYNLARHYDQVLTAAPDLAVQILRGVVPTRPGDAVAFNVNLAGRQFAIDLDGSDWYDDQPYLHKSDLVTMLEALENRAASSSDPGSWLGLLAAAPTPVVIWRRILAAAARNPPLAKALGPLDELVRTLAVHPLASTLASVVHAQFANADETTQAGIEAQVLEALPVGEPEDSETYRTRELYLHLLHALDRSLVSDATAAAMDASAKPSEPNIRLGTPFDFDRFGRADLTDPADRQVAGLIDAVETFVNAYLNTTPNAEQLATPVEDINELEKLIDSGYSGVLSERATDLLVTVAALWARCAPEDAGDLHTRACARLLGAVSAARPEATADSGDVPESDVIVIASGPRSDAARGLMMLARLPDQVDGELIEAIECLAQDSVRSVRHEVVARVTILRSAAPEVAWRILRERAENEPAHSVLREVVVQAWNFRSDMSQALDVIEVVAGRPTGFKKRYGAMGACAEAAGLLWVLFGEERAHSILNSHLNLDSLDADAIGVVLHRLRTFGCFTHDVAQVRRRTLEICAWLIEQGSARIDRLRGDPSPTEDQMLWIREGTSLLDDVTQELYFAAGVHDAQEQGNRPPTRAELRLVDEAGPLLDVLARVPIAQVAHHLVEIHAFTLEARPAEALRSMASVVAGGTRGTGYALESEAVKVLVSVVSTLLADHRSLFDDPDNLTALRTVLEVFIEDGTPDAHRLIYGIGQIFR
jgi:hypothetical protein